MKNNSKLNKSKKIESSNQLNILATLILSCSDENKFITKIQLLKLLQLWENSIHVKNEEEYLFIKDIQNTVECNKKIIYSLDDRKKILYNNCYDINHNKENMVI